MRMAHIGDTVLLASGEVMVTAVSDEGLVSVSVKGITIDFWPGELEWLDSHACWHQRPDSAPPEAKRLSGRPRLGNSATPAMRVGFAITKEQWLLLTERARRDGASHSDVARRALEAYLRDPVGK